MLASARLTQPLGFGKSRRKTKAQYFYYTWIPQLIAVKTLSSLQLPLPTSYISGIYIHFEFSILSHSASKLPELNLSIIRFTYCPLSVSALCFFAPLTFTKTSSQKPKLLLSVKQSQDSFFVRKMKLIMPLAMGLTKNTKIIPKLN